MLKLYTNYRSVSTHRVRIALNYKGVPYEPVYVDSDAGEHLKMEYLWLNPQGLVPALVVDQDLIITQSFAILEYLDERYPERPLLPEDLRLRAKVRSFAQIAVADMNPLNIVRVFRYMRDQMSVPYDARRQWFEHWAHKGFAAMEWMLAQESENDFAFGHTPPLADVWCRRSTMDWRRSWICRTTRTCAASTVAACRCHRSKQQRRKPSQTP